MDGFFPILRRRLQPVLRPTRTYRYIHQVINGCQGFPCRAKKTASPFHSDFDVPPCNDLLLYDTGPCCRTAGSRASAKPARTLIFLSDSVGPEAGSRGPVVSRPPARGQRDCTPFEKTAHGTRLYRYPERRIGAAHSGERPLSPCETVDPGLRLTLALNPVSCIFLRPWSRLNQRTWKTGTGRTAGEVRENKN